MEKDYRGREDGRIEVRRQSAVYLSLLSPRDGAGVKEGVKYSGKGQKRRTLSDVKQLQRWDATRGTVLLLTNAIRPSALIFIWSWGTLTFLRTFFWKNIHLWCIWDANFASLLDECRVCNISPSIPSAPDLLPLLTPLCPVAPPAAQRPGLFSTPTLLNVN